MYELSFTFNFSFNEQVDPQMLQELVEQVEYVTVALAQKEVDRNSGNEAWLETAKALSAELGKLSAAIGASM